MGEQLKIDFTHATVDQTVRFFREGSLLAGTIRSGPAGVITKVQIDSGESVERIRKLIRMAEQTCFALQSLVNPVAVETAVVLNGEPVTLE